MLPVPRPPFVYTGTLFVVLPVLTSALLAEAVQSVPMFLETLSAVFQELHVHGYTFAWFDRVPSAAAPPLSYYAMSRLMGV
ncbi:MAG: hypothetical protein IMZ69_08530 [Spirochaetes bacterium]|nr:hypothetical protein [Spirochaetota bacterium]